jgi:outer membrane immunogenic protein
MRSRRSFFLSSVAGSALTLATAASAADMAVKAPPLAPPPAWSWSGFYVGGNVGYGWGNSNTTVSFIDAVTLAVLAAPSQSFSMDGFIGGGQIGYNWQNGNWVWGVETDFQGSGLRGSATFVCGAGCAVPVTETLNEKLEWFGTVRGRLGFTVTPTVLMYATGGWVYGDFEADGFVNGTAFSVNTVKSGWTVGGGVEARIVGNWTGKVEYLYVDPNLNGQVQTGICNSSGACPPGHTLATSFNSGITASILRVGANYKF